MSVLEQHLHPPDRDPENLLASDWLIFLLRWLWLGSALVLVWLNPAQSEGFSSVVVVVAVGAILTQNTNWRGAERAVARLREADLLSPRKMAGLPPERLASLIRTPGWASARVGACPSGFRG